jgi:hypothetical protein
VAKVVQGHPLSAEDGGQRPLHLGYRLAGRDAVPLGGQRPPGKGRVGGLEDRFGHGQAGQHSLGLGHDDASPVLIRRDEGFGRDVMPGLVLHEGVLGQPAQVGGMEVEGSAS